MILAIAVSTNFGTDAAIIMTERISFRSKNRTRTGMQSPSPRIVRWPDRSFPLLLDGKGWETEEEGRECVCNRNIVIVVERDRAAGGNVSRCEKAGEEPGQVSEVVWLRKNGRETKKERRTEFKSLEDNC